MTRRDRLTRRLEMPRFIHMNTATTESPPGLVPIGEAARLLGVSVDTIRRWESKGIITATRTPLGQRRFATSEVERVRAAR